MRFRALSLVLVLACGCARGDRVVVEFPDDLESTPRAIYVMGTGIDDIWYPPTDAYPSDVHHFDGEAWAPVPLRRTGTMNFAAGPPGALYVSDDDGVYQLDADGAIDEVDLPAGLSVGTGSAARRALGANASDLYVFESGEDGQTLGYQRSGDGWDELPPQAGQVWSPYPLDGGGVLVNAALPNDAYEWRLLDGGAWSVVGTGSALGAYRDAPLAPPLLFRSASELWRISSWAIDTSEPIVVSLAVDRFEAGAWATVASGDVVMDPGLGDAIGSAWLMEDGAGTPLVVFPVAGNGERLRAIPIRNGALGRVETVYPYDVCPKVVCSVEFRRVTPTLIAFGSIDINPETLWLKRFD